MPLTTTIYAGLAARYTGTVDLGTLVYDLPKAADVSLATGTGTNQADILWTDTRTLSASTTEDLDLRGALVDVFGTTLNFVKVKYIRIKAAAGNTNNVVIGNDAASVQLGFGAITHTWAVPPGGVFLVSAPQSGWATTGTTADILQIANSGGGTSVTYDIEIFGTSA